MADIVDRETRSRMMSGIRGRDTKPELAIRRHLHAAGYRFRVHDRRLPGCPDLVLPKHRAVIFVHGCFWHHHEQCRFATIPATRAEFWKSKFESNQLRDNRNSETLLRAGWRVAVVWECAVKVHREESVTAQLIRWLDSSSPRLVVAQEGTNTYI